MKLNKIFAIALAALTMTACSDDDSSKINTAGGVTVEMAEAEIQFPEDQLSSASYYSIPVRVTGEANGVITVTIEVAEVGTSGAKEDENYIITSKTINIPAGNLEAGFEFYPKGDDIENADREFTVTITKAVGAAIGTQATSLVRLLDNESMIPVSYEGIQGVWIANTGEDEFSILVTGVAAGEEGYQSVLKFSGWQEYDGCVLTGKMACNPVNGETVVTFDFGQIIAEAVEFTGIGAYDVRLGGISGNSYYSSGECIATCNTDFNSMTFSCSQEICGGLYNVGTTQFAGYVWFVYESVTMTR